MGKSIPKSRREAEEVADEIAFRTGVEHDDSDLFAVGSQLTSNTETIDEAIRIVNERRYADDNESESNRKG